MDGAEIGVLQLLSQHEQLYVGITHQSYEKGFRGLLNHQEGRCLYSQGRIEILHDLSHDSMEGSGGDEQFNTDLSAGVLDLLLTPFDTVEFV